MDDIEPVKFTIEFSVLINKLPETADRRKELRDWISNAMDKCPEWIFSINNVWEQQS